MAFSLCCYVPIFGIIYLGVLLLIVIPDYTIVIAQSLDENGMWMVGTSMPNPRTEVTAVAYNNTVYVIGGFTEDGRISNLVEAYNISSNSWVKNIESIPISLHHASSAIIDGKIYVIGGYTGDWVPSDKMFIYDTITNNWTRGPPMPTERGSPTANIVAGKLYVIGGDSYDNPLATVEEYDPVIRNWTILSDMPTARHHAASAVIAGEIYVIGGRITGSLVNVDIVEKYDPTLDKWSADLTPMPSKRSGIGATSLDGFIYVLGGEQNQGTFDNNERYDPKTDAWTIEFPMPTPRHGLGLVSIDDKIFAVGGGPHPGLTVTGQNEIYFLKH
ncbi:MAG TPA: kelch repeat-containing protein [Candidatus Saccharimonadales bacterium]|nr:kelch repeat-containing protein [Candidatus Saccharimonadales bacterium]